MTLTATDPGPLIEFVPRCNPVWTRSLDHQVEFLGVLECAPYGSLRAMCSEPIRHYKTSCVIAAIAWWLKKFPRLRIIYMTYSILRSENVGKDIRDACERMGVGPVRGRDTIKQWSNSAGGGVSVMSAQQSRLGEDCDILIVDDPYESGEEADKPEIRQVVDETIVHYTMRLSRGGSVIIVMSRWHPDDAVGRRLKREGWIYIHNRAVIDNDDGTRRAFAPEVRTLAELDAIRAAIKEADPTERLWWAQWQNEPITPTANYFGDPLRYSVIPGYSGFIDGMGADLAFTTNRNNDWFALVVARIYMGSVYIRNAYRFHADPRLAAPELQLQLSTFGHMPIFSYMSGPERGSVSTLAQQGIHVQAMQPRVNKLWRSQRTINLWNAGRILLPIAPLPWVKPFIERAKLFRGVEGDDDDEIDALVSLVNALVVGDSISTPIALGQRRV